MGRIDRIAAVVATADHGSGVGCDRGREPDS
jgi:hypothetical protein